MSSVRVYKYDLTNGMAKQLSPMFLGFQIDAIWHTSIVAYGKEHYFDGGVGIETVATPGTSRFGRPLQVEEIGTTNKPETEFRSWIAEVGRSKFGPNDYHLLQNNCNNFSSEACRFLFDNQKDIPEDVKTMIPKLLATPMGQMVRPILEQMTTQNVGRSERDQFSNLQQQFAANTNTPPGAAPAQNNSNAAASTSSSSSTAEINEEAWDKLMKEVESKPAAQSLNSVMWIEGILSNANVKNTVVYAAQSGTNNVELDEKFLECLGFRKQQERSCWKFCGSDEVLETAKILVSSLQGDIEIRWSQETQ